MDVVVYRVGELDDARQGYPLALFNLKTGDRLAPPAGGPTDLLPQAVLQTPPWTPDTIRAAFANNATIKKDLLDAGRTMFGWLDRDSVGKEWRAKRAAGAATLLEVVKSKKGDLSDLPWELMVDNRQIFGFDPISRFHSGTASQPLENDWPLRLLIVDGSGGDPQVNAAAEIRRIRADLLWHRHSIDIDVDIPADPKAFEKTLSDFQPHVLHFIGHSGVSKTLGLSTLFVQVAANRWELDSTTIQSALTDSKVNLRLAFLNACHTANRADAYEVGAAFSSTGVPATLTMQGAVAGDEAGKFAAEVYKHLVGGGLDLADAVRRARGAFDPGRPHHWAFPVLSLAEWPNDLMPRRPAIIDQRFTDTDSCKIFQQVRLFSGRAHERRKLRTAICPISNGGKPVHLLIVVGAPQHGKSHLAKRCLECLSLRGHNVQYVEVADTGSKDQVTFLMDTFRRSEIGLAIPELEKAFKRFKWDADQILKRGVPTSWDGVADIAEPTEFEPAELKSENALSLLAAAALAALGDAATAAAPLLIVFDQFRDQSGDLSVSDALFEKFLWPSFFEPIRRGDVPNVYAALIFGRDDAEKVYRVHEKISQDRWLNVNDLPADKFDDLVDELFGYLAPDKLRGVDKIAEGAKANLNKVPTTSLLLMLQQAADVLFPDRAHRVHVGRSR